MTFCEICGVWFHPKCLGLSKKDVESVFFFFCPYCIPTLSREDLALNEEPEISSSPKNSPGIVDDNDQNSLSKVEISSDSKEDVNTNNSNVSQSDNLKSFSEDQRGILMETTSQETQ